MDNVGIANAMKMEERVINVGDILKFWTDGYTLYEFREGLPVRNGNRVFEVEVKDVKTAKLILE